jgi:hypothetical protein
MTISGYHTHPRGRTRFLGSQITIPFADPYLPHLRGSGLMYVFSADGAGYTLTLTPL